MELKNKYFIKNSEINDYQDITTLFDGVRILKIDGFEEQGKPVNIYTAHWIDNQTEDFQIATLDEHNNPVVIRENPDIEITFIVGNRYAEGGIDVREQHDEFVSFLTDSDVYVFSTYTLKEAHCVCLESYKPTTEKLQRQGNSYIMGTIRLHVLEEMIAHEAPTPPTPTPPTPTPEDTNEIYAGFGASTISTTTDIQSLTNVQHKTGTAIFSKYTTTTPSTAYLWLCTDATITKVTSSGFEIPMQTPITIGKYNCYRSSNSIASGSMVFYIE